MFAPKLYSRVINSTFQNQVRSIQSNDSLLDNCTFVRNRNPRNLEYLTIAQKPKGYFLEKYKFDFWHKAVLVKTNRYITLELHHFQNGKIFSVSTQDLPLKRQLRKATDTDAHLALAEVFAQRCLESGITMMASLYNETKNPKVSKLKTRLIHCGLILKEPSQMRMISPWDKKTAVKPWELEV